MCSWMLSQRVEIFHQTVSDDRKSLGIGNPRDHSSRGPATYVTVHRGRVLEDGFTQLSSVPTRALKGLIRVKFVNEQVILGGVLVLSFISVYALPFTGSG